MLSDAEWWPWYHDTMIIISSFSSSCSPSSSCSSLPSLSSSVTLESFWPSTIVQQMRGDDATGKRWWSTSTRAGPSHPSLISLVFGECPMSLANIPVLRFLFLFLVSTVSYAIEWWINHLIKFINDERRNWPMANSCLVNVFFTAQLPKQCFETH